MDLFKWYKQAYKEKRLIINEEKTYGILESLLSAFIFFSPNFLLFFPNLRNALFIFILYNYIIIFMLVSTIANLKFKV